MRITWGVFTVALLCLLIVSIEGSPRHNRKLINLMNFLHLKEKIIITNNNYLLITQLFYYHGKIIHNSHTLVKRNFFSTLQLQYQFFLKTF